MPKGPEGGEYPNAPLPINDALPGQESETAEAETYTIMTQYNSENTLKNKELYCINDLFDAIDDVIR